MLFIRVVGEFFLSVYYFSVKKCYSLRVFLTSVNYEGTTWVLCRTRLQKKTTFLYKMNGFWPTEHLEFRAHIIKKPICYSSKGICKIEGHPDCPFEFQAASVLHKSGMQFCWCGWKNSLWCFQNLLSYLKRA